MTFLQFYLNQNIDYIYSDTPLNYYEKDNKNANYNKDINDSKTPKNKSTDLNLESKTKPIKNKIEILEGENIISLKKNIEDLELKLRDITTLQELQKFVENFKVCQLKAHSTNTIFGIGQTNSPKVMIIKDAPEKNDDRSGEAFSGEGGKLLKDISKYIGLSTEKDLYLANSVNWWPPGNRSPKDDELSICMPILKKHIEFINPQIIVLAGTKTAQFFLNKKDSIIGLRKKVNFYEMGNKRIPCFSIYSPTFLIKNPQSKKTAMMDFIKVKSKIKEIS